jgi:hypothetical protein
MAKKAKTNGNGPDRTDDLLSQILVELQGHGTRLERMELGLEHLGVKVERVENVLLEARRDLREITGERLGERVARLEARLPTEPR